MKKVIKETWCELGRSVVVAETYADGGVLFFLHNYKGDRLPFFNIKRLDEEGSVVTKEEAMRHLENVRAEIKSQSAAPARPPE